MYPGQITISFLPLSLYFLLLLWFNTRKRPYLISGVQDLSLLAVGMTGFMFIGPLSFFVPMHAFSAYQSFVWPLLVGLYILLVPFICGIGRPRLVVYNIREETMREISEQISQKIDEESQWAGNSLFIPNLGIQLYLENGLISRTSALVATSRGQNPNSWRTLEVSLAEALSGIRTTPSPVRWPLRLAAAVFFLLASYGAVVHIFMHFFKG